MNVFKETGCPMDLRGTYFPTFPVGLEPGTALAQLGRSRPEKTAFSSSSNAKEYKQSFPNTKLIKTGKWCHLLQSSSGP